ncbi:hypothetical protein [Marinicrinis sediminis]|uniref:Glycosyltransferase n=1 Tax=Marinicrinis sediminis TaxID=1652465 RepID=A0ABW5RBD9_9BACL
MNIVYFAPIRWDFLKQRPQHIAEELSQYYKVCFVEPSISIINSLVYKNDDYKPRDFNISENLRVLRPSGKFRLPKIFELVDFVGFNLIYEKIYLKEIMEQADLIWLGSPIFYSLIEKTKKSIIYDKMDEHGKLVENYLMKQLIEKNEKKLLKRADLILASSRYLYEQIQLIEESVELVRNGLDQSICMIDPNAANNRLSHEIKKIKENDKNLIFGYVGTIDHWFDFSVIKQIVNHDDRNKVVIVGHNKLPVLNHPNVFYFDAVPKDELGLIIKEFDFGLYPFKQGDLLDTIDPVKIYDYLSFNKAVIAVSSTETSRFEGKVNLYTNDKELNDILKKSRETRYHYPFTESETKCFINENSWSNRTSIIIDYMKKHRILN